MAAVSPLSPVVLSAQETAQGVHAAGCWRRAKAQSLRLHNSLSPGQEGGRIV